MNRVEFVGRANQEAARDAINDAQQVRRRNADKKRTDAALIMEGDWLLKREGNQ